MHFTGWSHTYDEWIAYDNPRLQKQWKKGAEFKINNRIDVLDEIKVWREARVIKVTEDKIRIHYYKFKPMYDEDIDKDSPRISPVGTNSTAFGIGNIRYRMKQKAKKTEEDSEDEVEDPDSDNEKEIKRKEAEDLEKLLEIIGHEGKKIHRIEGDGNCVFRAISHQLYGTEDHHFLLRQVTMDYLILNREEFENFVSSGNLNYHVSHYRQSGRWVGHLEIAALARIYNVTIHVYTAGGPIIVNEEAKDKRGDIFISYHNERHYNSVVPINLNPDEEHKLLDNFGEIEQWIRALMRAKSKESHEYGVVFNDEKEIQDLDQFIKDNKDDLYKWEADLNQSMKNSNFDLRDIDSVINERYNLKMDS